ncbi:hypothetical protein ABEV55_13725 [Aneurinibacillus thermoaerophilus]|uniref:hypothetical protein n=1 Tax=Aneurinibacillus thermoaerophilus TaxID=143495 RepID=UPI002E2427E4|nr:hypothetical protein [Aneurinibacillus thermoaerophilus]
MPRIEFDVSDETYQGLVQLGIISSHFAKERPFSPIELCKGAVLQYLSRFSTESISDNECIFLLSDLQLFIGPGTLKNRIREYM